MQIYEIMQVIHVLSMSYPPEGTETHLGAAVTPYLYSMNATDLGMIGARWFRDSLALWVDRLQENE